MGDDATDETMQQRGLGPALAAVGIAACIMAVAATGGLSIFAGIVATFCLAGSFIAGSPPPAAFEADFNECDRLTADDRSEPAPAPSQEAEVDYRWRQVVEGSRRTGQSR